MESTKGKIALGIIVAIVLVALIAVIIIDPGTEEEEENTTDTTNTTNTTTTNEEENTSTDTSSEDEDTADDESNLASDAQAFLAEVQSLSSDEALANAKAQMAEPEEGDTIAIMHIKNYGDITIKFFSDVAPKAVENFITHAEEGYYDGVTFHRVIDEFMIQGGDPNGTGYGGESIWGEDFDEELSATILPYRGALCMASSGTGTTSLGSQFYIVQANYSESDESNLSLYNLSNLASSYEKYGGSLTSLVGYAQYTTFGQVIDGMDVVDEIASVETDSNDKPTTDVIIESIEITTYSK